MENIFEILFSKNICFAVVVGTNTFSCKGNECTSKDYFLLLLQSKIKSPYIKFTRNVQYRKAFTYNLSENEVLIFKQHLDKFNRIISDDSGRVFELKDNSFKKQYLKIKSHENRTNKTI